MRCLFFCSLACLAIQTTELGAAEQQAAAALAAQQRNYGFAVPAEVDPQEKSQRVLLLLPGGPLVVELLMTIDGQAFQSHREQMIDDALRAADADGDGKTTWEEAVAKPNFAGGRYAHLEKQQKQSMIGQFDKNKDGLVDRVELRMMYAQLTGGPAFMVQNYGYGQPAAPLRELLDENKNGLLESEELAAVATRLKSRDANDNDVVDLAELSGNPYGGYGYVQQGRGMLTQPGSLLFPLYSGADWKIMFDALQKRYGKEGRLTAERWPGTPDLVAKLDENKNQALDKDELSGLLGIDPHLVFEVNFGDGGELPPGGRLKPGTPSLPGAAQEVKAGDVATLDLPGVRLQFAYSSPLPNLFNANSYAISLLNTYDKDKNGYLEKDELAGQQQLVAQFATWDLDGDGKVYPDEIKQAFAKADVSTRQRVALSAVDQGDALFSLLDADGNGRLGLRELRSGPARLRAADKDGDGQISLAELPATIRLTVNHGGASGGQFVQLGNGRVVPASPAAKPAGPEWFVRMDTNGDGDVTPREFLGDAEQFRQLDTNGDAFIDPQEAAAVK